jgi:preprotein translocase subunit SecE
MANNEKKSQPAEVSTNAVKKDTSRPGFFKRVAKWFRELKSELKKVVWPTPKQTANNVGVALAVMAVSAIVLWGFDSLAQAGVRALINLAG